MTYRFSVCLFVGLISVYSAGATGGNVLKTYSAPKGATLNKTFTVAVRRPKGSWKTLDVHDVRVDYHTLKNPNHASFVNFDFSGEVEVRVTYNAGTIKEARIRPKSYGITCKPRGKTAVLKLTRPRMLSFEVNGDRLRNLHIFANALEKEKPSQKSKEVIYFPPGLHKLGTHPAIRSYGKVNGYHKAEIRVESGQTVYLDGGALVQATISVVKGAKNVKIHGRGILDLSPWNTKSGRTDKGRGVQVAGVSIRSASHVEIEGIVIKQPTAYSISGGACSHVKINGVKAISGHMWGDGIDMMASSDITISGVFLRTSDDCIAIYGSRWGFRGDSRNWLIKDSVFWADKAKAMFMGIHGDFEGDGDTIENITFRNIDVLEKDGKVHKHSGAIMISCGDKNVCRNILYEDIRVENIDKTANLIYLGFGIHRPSTVAGKAIEDITFRNIVYDGPCGSLIQGHSPKQTVKGVHFENVRIRGKTVQNPADGKIKIGPHVTGVEFSAKPSAKDQSK